MTVLCAEDNQSGREMEQHNWLTCLLLGLQVTLPLVRTGVTASNVMPALSKRVCLLLGWTEERTAGANVLLAGDTGVLPQPESKIPELA